MKKFELSKARTPGNPNGAEVVTRNGETVTITKVITPMLQNQKVIYPIIGKIGCVPYCWQEDGVFYSGKNNYDLFLKEEEK